MKLLYLLLALTIPASALMGGMAHPVLASDELGNRAAVAGSIYARRAETANIKGGNVSGTGAAQAPAPAIATDDFQKKQEALDALFRAQVIGGGAYLLSYRIGDRSFAAGYGSLDCAATQTMPADAIFGAGSISKHFTSAAIMKLVEDGRLKVDDRLGGLFRGVPAGKADITVAQLLAHRSGIPNFIDRGGRPIPANQWSIAYDNEPLTRAELLKAAWRAPLEFAPGSNEAYSNYGYQILAAIVESRAGEPFERYVRRTVLLPLHMTDTAPTITNHNLPLIEQCRDGRAVLEPVANKMRHDKTGWRLIGAGSMLTSLADLQRWSAGIETGALFRADLQERFNASYFGPSYRCRTRITAVGGSNGLTRSLIIHLPSRKETVVMVSTHREWRLPAEEKVIAILCPTNQPAPVR